jgi:beta-glucanase (GH16 family)
LSEVIGDLEPRYPSSRRRRLRRSNAGGIHERTNRDVHVLAVPHDREEERAAGQGDERAGVKASAQRAEVKAMTRTATRVVLATVAAIAALHVLGTASAAASTRCFGHRATIVGTKGDDHLVGTAGRDVIVAGRGHDRVRTREGNDLVCGGPGRDELVLGPGGDKAASGRGNDRIEGRGGADVVDGGAGTDRLNGGTGTDTCRRGENVRNCEPVAFDWASAEWDGSHKSQPLDLTGYTKTFEDDFDSLSTITDGVTGSGPWYAPARPDTSLAHFLSPLQIPVTFSIDTPGVLTITMQKVDTSWYSGHIQTVNNIGEGFAQRHGYFEARMAFEKAVSWPAFWLYTPKPDEGPDQARAEIDVIEAYGDADYDGYHMAVHRHSLESNVSKGNYSGLSSTQNMGIWGWNDMFDGQFHRYGCMVTPRWITIYLDGKELSRFPTFPEAKLPLYMRVTLAMQDEFVASATSPTRLWIDYVRAYARP